MKCKHCQKEYPTLRGGYCGSCKRLWEPKNTDILLKNATSVQLLQELGQRIATGEIKSDANRDYLCVVDELFCKIIVVDIETGKTEQRKEHKHA